MSDQKTVVISGVSSGLGRALVDVFLTKGYAVYGLSKTQMKDRIESSSFHFYRCDIRKYEELVAIASKIGTVDILINNAGIILQGEFRTYGRDQIKDVVDTDILGLMYVTHTFLPKIPTRPGSFIVNVSSTAGTSDKAGETVYRAAKHGVRGFTDSLRLELGRHNIKVVGFYPGGMKTDLFSKSGSSVDTSKYMDPKDIAQNIAYIVGLPDSLSMDTVIINRGIR